MARGEADSSVRTATDGRVQYRVVAVAAGDGRALVIGQRLDATRAVLTRLGVALPAIGGVGVALAALAGVAVARTGLRPVQQLTEATERVAATGELRPIPVDGSDELARLTASFNDMLGALAASQEQQRRLVADAGHELRTPLTSMRTNLELLTAASRPGAPPLPESDHAEILDDLQAQIAELSTLVGDLVELAREDAPQVVHEPVELTDVVERALERARRRAGDVEFDRDARAVDAHRRRDRAGTCGAQPARQRGQVEPAGCDGARADAAAGPVVGAAGGGRRRARASPSRTCRASSTASTGRPGRGRCPARAWGCRSCVRWRSGTAARSGPGAPPRAAPCWCCACRGGLPPERAVAGTGGSRAESPDRSLTCDAVGSPTTVPDAGEGMANDNPDSASETSEQGPGTLPRPDDPAARPDEPTPQPADPAARTAEHDYATWGPPNPGQQNPGQTAYGPPVFGQPPAYGQASDPRPTDSRPTGSRRTGRVQGARRPRCCLPPPPRARGPDAPVSGPSPPSAWSPHCSAAGSAATSGTSRRGAPARVARRAFSPTRCHLRIPTPPRSARWRPWPPACCPAWSSCRSRGCARPAKARGSCSAQTGSCSPTTTSSRPRRTAAGSWRCSRTAPARPRRSSVATRARTSPCCGLRVSPG